MKRTKLFRTVMELVGQGPYVFRRVYPGLDRVAPGSLVVVGFYDHQENADCSAPVIAIGLVYRSDRQMLVVDVWYEPGGGRDREGTGRYAIVVGAIEVLYVMYRERSYVRDDD
jgi:hypothetical protein